MKHNLASIFHLAVACGWAVFFIATEASGLQDHPGNQTITAEQRVRGYQHQNGRTTFIFDQNLYGVRPERVVVTGEFRGWDQDMDDPTWQLTRSLDQPELWLLDVAKADAAGIGPSTPFKFRIDKGTWLQPPGEAPNQSMGNLIHRPGEVRPRLRAEITADGTIEVRVEGIDTTNLNRPERWDLVTADGHRVSIGQLDVSKNNLLRLSQLHPAGAEVADILDSTIDRTRVHYLTDRDSGLRCLVRRDGWFRTLRSDRSLGANLSTDELTTTFGLFAPRCTRVHLYLYRGAEDPSPLATLQMTPHNDGVWTANVDQSVVSGSHHGLYYDFTVHGPADPGNTFYETHPVHVSDPYARVSVDSFGRCRVWRPTTPASPLAGGRPALEDVVAYEVHVEDFTNRLPIDASKRGTISGMVEPGLTNHAGQPIGFDHLLDLGINVVHLMPVQEFLHYSNDVWREAFADDPYMIAAGVAETNYQWGYRTTHAFAIETRYRTVGSDHGSQRDQFRDLVQKFHDHGIAVIIDLVPNHTGENMDGRHELFNFNAIDMPYYYRTDEDLCHIGPFGNEVKTEDRPMVQRWLIDQCRHFVDEFGIDGFRIDLAGQIDKQTLTKLKAALPEDLIIYGEPWIAPSDPDVASDPRYGWYKADAPITFFQDSARNAMKGPVSNPQDKATDRGYAGGDASQRGNVQLALTNGFEDEIQPNRGINYLDIHDNWALADRFALTDWDGRRGVDEARYKVAAGLLMTSLGPLVLHGGVEIMRSKGAAPLREVIKELPDGPLVFHGKSDTYNMRTANEFVWDLVGKPISVPPNDADDFGQGVGDFPGVHDYIRGLIHFRRSDLGRVFRRGSQPPTDYFRWILPEDPHQLGYIVDDAVMVLVNVSDQAATLHDLPVQVDQWRRVADGDRVDLTRGVAPAPWQIDDAGRVSLEIPPTSLHIFVRAGLMNQNGSSPGANL